MIYDCILYAGERDVLEIRLNELNDIVDRFVIVEATHDLQGGQRNFYPLTFRSTSQFAGRIDHIVVDEPLPLDPMTAETYLRNQVLRGLTRADKDDLVICSDVDEIPRASLIKHLVTTYRHWDQVFRFNLTEYYYTLDWQIPIQVRWKLSFITSMWRLAMSSPGRIRQEEGNVYYDAGWHFSCLGSAHDLQRKLRTFSHAELNTPEHTDLARLEECIRTGNDLLIPPRFQCLPVVVDSTYPQYVQDNFARFYHLLRNHRMRETG